MTTPPPIPGTVRDALGSDADALLRHDARAIPKAMLQLPGPDFVDRVFAPTDRPVQVLNNLARFFGHGRLAGTGYLSILPVDQGIEHSAGASFAKNPIYFDPENIVRLAIEGGCNAVASSVGVLGAVARHHYDVRRPLAHAVAFALRRVACAHEGSDFQLRQAECLQFLADARERGFQVTANVIGEGLER